MLVCDVLLLVLLSVSVSSELLLVVSLSVVSVLSVLSVCVAELALGSEVVSFSLLQATRAKTRVNTSNSDKILFNFKTPYKKSVQPKPHTEKCTTPIAATQVSNNSRENVKTENAFLLK